VIEIFSIIITIPTTILFLVLVITYRSISTYKNGMMFAVTLPAHATEHPKLQSIQHQYNKQFKRCWLSMLLAYFPIFIMYNWPAFQITYYLFWTCAFVIIIVIPHRKAFRATLQLKREEDWFVGKKHVIQADLRAAQLKNKRTAPLELFILPLALGAWLTWWLNSKDIQLTALGISAIATTVLFLGISLLIRRSRSTVYSENSEVNIALNQNKRRSLSYLFFLLALVEIVHFYFIAQLLLQEQPAMSQLWLILSILYTLIPLLLIIAVYSSIRSVQRNMLSLDGSPVYSDDDEYWANGFTYHNPYDKSILVPKRVGIGETINTGTMAGKIIMGGTIGLLIAVVLGVSFMLIRSELISPTMLISSEQEITIDYPMYSFTFNVEDIEEATLVDSIPTGVKTNGEATGKYSRGHFRLQEIGKARLYVFRNNPPYIKLTLKDQVVYYNEENPEMTEERYKEIVNAMK